MFFQILEVKRSQKSYRYLKLIETYRQGIKIKHRTLANLGNFDDLSTKCIGGLFQSLLKVWRRKLDIGNREADEQMATVIPFRLREKHLLEIRQNLRSVSSNAIW